MTNTRVAELINQNNFVSILKNELYALIDEELAKDTEMDCDLIDELVNAIEALEQCEDENPAVILPLIFADGTILSKRIRNKVNGKKTLMRITALAAAFAMILSGANQIPATEGKSVLVYAVDEFLEGIGEIFGIEKLLEKEETPTTPEIEESTTTPEKVEEEIKEQSKEPIATAPEIVSIGLITYGSFKSSYLWKEELDLTGLKVVAVYSDDTEKVIPVSDCEISGFNSLKLGEQLVTVKYKGVSAFFKVTVSKTEQNNAETRKITNIECNVTGKDVIVPKGTENPAIANNVKYFPTELINEEGNNIKEEALEYFNKSIALNNFQSHVYYRRALTLYHLSDYAAAMSDLNVAKQLGLDNEECENLNRLILKKLKMDV